MTIECFDSYDALSNRAADVIAETTRGNSEAHLCLATGASPLGAYREVGRRVTGKELNSSRLQITKLDEWLGIPMSHPSTCETFLRSEVLVPWQVADERYLSFDANLPESGVECARVEKALEALPPFDLCVLGIGANGHLGLNEPATELQVEAHVASLAESTRNHPMLCATKLEQGMTLGIGRIMASQRILLLVVGESKSEAWKKLLEPVVTTNLPASLLHLHPDVICLSMLPV